MAEMKWTKEQQQVIDARGRNLLVSAAAGSGKTAVLVERIVRMVTDPDHPVDIDRLLVMTFTNAAAAEMRERIGDALEKRLEEEPGDRNLERQTSLIHHARITTIDSFCLKLLREHFNELDIDPGFRIGDEGELLLLQADVMKELLEDYYGREDGRFLRFVDTYASGKADGGLEDYILQVWRFSQSNPWPGQWIAACKKELSEETDGDLDGLENAEWMRFLVRDVKRQAGEFAEQLAEAKALAAKIDELSVTVSIKAGEGGRTFGSVSTKEIAKAAADQLHLDIDKKKMVLTDPIRSLGTFEVPIKLHKDVTAKLRVKVTEA